MGALITPRWSHDTGWRLLSRSLSSFSPVFLISGPVLGLSGVLDQWLVLLLNSDSIEILHKCIHQLGLEDQLCKSCQRKSGRGPPGSTIGVGPAFWGRWNNEQLQGKVSKTDSAIPATNQNYPTRPWNAYGDARDWKVDPGNHRQGRGCPFPREHRNCAAV